MNSGVTIHVNSDPWINSLGTVHVNSVKWINPLGSVHFLKWTLCGVNIHFCKLWTRLEDSPQLDVSKASLKSDLKDGRTPSQSQMMMIAKEILKIPTWAEGRKQTTN